MLSALLKSMEDLNHLPHCASIDLLKSHKKSHWLPLRYSLVGGNLFICQVRHKDGAKAGSLNFGVFFFFYEFSTKAFVLNPGSSLNKLRKITENLGLNVNSRLALYWHINRKSPRKKKTEKTGSHINQTDTKLPLHIKYYYQICSFICVCACVCVSTRQLIPLMLKIHRCGSASVMWVTQTAVQASLYSQTERKKDNHKHNVDTTAAKWCTNTFYQPPLTS